MPAPLQRCLIAYSLFGLALCGVVSSPVVAHDRTQIPAMLLVALAAFLFSWAERTGWLVRFHDSRFDFDLAARDLSMSWFENALGFCIYFGFCGCYIYLTGGTSSPYFFVLFYPIMILGMKGGLILNLPLCCVFSAIYYALGQGPHDRIGLAVASMISFPFMAFLAQAINMRLERSAVRLARRIHDLDTLMDVSRMLDTAIDLHTTVNLILINAPESSTFSVCAIYLIDDESDGVMTLRDFVPRSSNATLLDHVIIDAALRDHRDVAYEMPLVFDRRDRLAEDGDIIAPGRPVYFDPKALSVVYAPLRGSDGLIGVLCFSRTSGTQFEPAQIGTISRYASHVGLSLQQALYRDRLERMAFNDTITGLANYRYFERRLTEELSRCSRRDEPLSVIMLDIDYFKGFNDAYGHRAGDVMLTRVGAAIRHALREADTPARYGGEEFVVVCPDTTRTQALAIMERIREAVETMEVYLFGLGFGQGGRARVTVSLGAATYPLDAQSADSLVGLADKALYAAKESGRNRSISAADLVQDAT
ncbi:MAG: diguanylate cyclase [Capsulimonadaceae bacterium]|nr:diguanylate cyclase [Capsulimonadaceae bacterium]